MVTKSDTNLKYIDTSRAKKNLRKPKWAKNKTIVSFDTETSNGDIFIISTSSPKKDFVYHNNGDIIEPERIFDIITQKYFRNTLNVWYNLGFDAEVILKVLPEDTLSKLQVTNQVIWKDEYRIVYLPNKYLRIETGITHRDEKGPNFQNSVEYYDIAQLFQNNLKGAIDEWLPDSEKSKNEQDINVKKFSDKEYVNKNFDKIANYAKDDAHLTRLISERLINIAEDIGIPCGKPFSTGYLAENYLKETLDFKPGWGPEPMQKMAWDSYSGGRFEVFSRGNVGKVVGPDINSAYPWVMQKLPDPKTLSWQYFNEIEALPTINEIEKADYGFIKAEITTDKSKKIQPFAVKIDGVVKYPALQNYEITTLKDIFVWAIKNDYIEDYRIKKCFLGFENENTKYPFDFFPELYDQRKKWEDMGKVKRAWLLKIILNSMYGKTAQTQFDVTLIDNEMSIDEIPKGIKVSPGPKNEYPHMKEQVSGSLFNPFIASYITGLTRLELHRQVENYDLIDDTILFATDSIMVSSKAYYDSNFQDLLGDNSIPYSKQLGMWDFDYKGNGFVIGSGVYEVALENGDIKMATRGFRESKLESFRKEAKKTNEEYIKIKHNRPKTLGEAIHQKKIGIEDIGSFFEGERKLKPDFDNKRNWEKSPTWNTLLNEKEDSQPLVISG